MVLPSPSLGSRKPPLPPPPPPPFCTFALSVGMASPKLGAFQTTSSHNTSPFCRPLPRNRRNPLAVFFQHELRVGTKRKEREGSAKKKRKKAPPLLQQQTLRDCSLSNLLRAGDLRFPMSSFLGSRAGSKAKAGGSKVAQSQSHAGKSGGSDDANPGEVRGRTTPDAEDDQSNRMGSPSNFLREPSPWAHSASLSGMRPNGTLQGGVDSAGAAMAGAMGTSSLSGTGPFAGGFGISTVCPAFLPHLLGESSLC